MTKRDSGRRDARHLRFVAEAAEASSRARRTDPSRQRNGPMNPKYEAALAEYVKFTFADGPWTRSVYRRGSGPAVIVVHEIPGLHPLVIRFADRIVAAGMTVFPPALFGEPGRPVTSGYALRSMLSAICIHREFNVWSTGRSSPIVVWLRALARKAHAECGGRGVGAIGMCFTGGFALAVMTEFERRCAGVVPAVIAGCRDVEKGRCRNRRCARRGRLRKKSVREREPLDDRAPLQERPLSSRRTPRELSTFGDKFEAIELEDADAAPADRPPHSVLTIHMREDGPTRPPSSG